MRTKGVEVMVGKKMMMRRGIKIMAVDGDDDDNEGPGRWTCGENKW